MTADRMHVDVSADPRLADRVADNLFRAQKFDGTESETLQIGTNFGITTDIEQGPDGNLYVVSNTDNAIYKISRLNPPRPGKGGKDPEPPEFVNPVLQPPVGGALGLSQISAMPDLLMAFGRSVGGTSRPAPNFLVDIGDTLPSNINRDDLFARQSSPTDSKSTTSHFRATGAPESKEEWVSLLDAAASN
jgi:hypothetical protein